MMKPIFLAGSLVLAAVFTVRLSGATVDGGFTSELIGTAQGGRLAIIAEASIQESCQYQECTIYVIDTTQTEFKRTQMVRLPSRNDELKKSLCRGLGRDECVKKVSSQLIAEEQHERSNYQILVERYLSSLTIWDRTRLGKVAPGPEPEKLK